MKIIIVTQKEPFFIQKVLKAIIGIYKDYLESIVFLKPDEYKKKIKMLFYYLKFWGFFQLLKFGIFFFIKMFQRKIDFTGIEIIKDLDVNSKKFVEKAKSVDYIISIAANQIFKEELLTAPREMCLNIHASLLPKNKGFNPSFWVLYKNENYTAVTIHKMEKDLDSGPILRQEKIKIRFNETWYSLQNRVASKASDILIDILPKLIEKDLNLKEPKGESSLYKKPAIGEGKEFRRRGNKFI